MENFVVRFYSEDTGPSIKGNGFDGLLIGQTRDEAEEFITWINKRLEELRQYQYQKPPPDGLRQLPPPSTDLPS